MAHELGHQFDADHTFDGVDGACGGNGGGPSVEPGSGATVMAYAGICGADNLQPHSDPYFSQRSIAQVTSFLAAPPGTVNEVQTVSLYNFDGADSFTLTYANQTTAMKAVFKSGAFQTARVPEAATTAAVAATGLQLHIGGHMHFNGSNDYTDANGNYLANLQSPSLAVYGAAYKIVTFKDKDTADIQTVGLNEVPRFKELFPFYETEYAWLQSSSAPADVAKRWNRAVLDTTSYGKFTHYYFGELSRLRFMDEYWPCEMKEAAISLNLAQMLTMTQLQTAVTFSQLKDVPNVVPLTAACTAVGTATGTAVAADTLAADWAQASSKARKLATGAGLDFDAMATVTAYDFYGDFHRTVYAGELSLRDMGETRVKQYKLLMSAFPAAPAAIVKVGDKPSDQNAVQVLFQNQFKQVFSIFKGLGSGKPSDHFVVDFKNKKLTNANAGSLTFN
jgi:hypothetical protein